MFWMFFFALNRPNYTRWGVLFLNKLITAPSQCKKRDGGFSIRRSKKNYSRSPVDLTLEQTVNCNAASPSKVIVHMHNSHDTIVKWVTTANQRSTVVTEVQRLTGTENVEKPSAQNTNRGKVKDNADWETQEHYITELHFSWKSFVMWASLKHSFW